MSDFTKIAVPRVFTLQLDPCSPFMLQKCPPVAASSSTNDVAAVSALNCGAGPGIEALSRGGDGIVGRAHGHKHGVFGACDGAGIGVAGNSGSGTGVYGESAS